MDSLRCMTRRTLNTCNVEHVGSVRIDHLTETKEPKPNQTSFGRKVTGYKDTCGVRIQISSFLGEAWSTELRNPALEFPTTLSDPNLLFISSIHCV